MAVKNKSSTYYLLAYNSLQTVGWTYLFFQFVQYYVSPKTSDSLYDTVKYTLLIFQNAAVLEIAHAYTKLVPSSPMITMQQIFSRVLVVCGVLTITDEAQQSHGLPLLLMAWSITEIIRYLYYVLNLLSAVPHVLVWLRYTTFIVLYPVGVTGELLCIYSAQNELKRTGMWTITLPNCLNFSFYYPYLLAAIMLLYIPLFPQMYLHMFVQRRKVLGDNTNNKTIKNE
ncbi:hypothetical protein FQA39_LY14623 [Lamprigera yunnana]|nr:hypothetical protein FQA39_LY14623 [Lamprigera yunnana]